MATKLAVIKPEPVRGITELASAIVEAGAQALLENADGVEMRLLRIGTRSLPVAVCEAGHERASYLSPTRHYLSYPIEEIAKRSRVWSVGRLRAVLWPLKMIMETAVVDRVVYPNHWLIVSRPSLGMDRVGIDALIASLKQDYPRHAIVFSNIIPAVSRQTYRNLIAAGCTLVPSRRVWFFDTERSLKGRAFSNIRRLLNKNRRLLQGAESRSFSDRDTLLSHVSDFTRLYRSLYIEKHCHLNPQYTEEFFRLFLECESVTGTGWYGPGGEVEAFALQIILSNRVVWSVSGNDRELSRERSLTQLISAHHIEQARAIRGVLHWGGGADEYKRNRGAIQAQEFDAVYTDHLPAARRLPWYLLKHLRGTKAPCSLDWGNKRPVHNGEHRMAER